MIEKLPKKVYWRNQKMIQISSMSRFFVIIIIAGLGLMVFAIFAAMAAESEATEFDLDPNGQAFEIYWGNSGDLWLTDSGGNSSPGALWQIFPNTQVYNRYEVPNGASDAHVDGQGKVWWTNITTNTLNRLVPGELTATTWPLTGTNGAPTGVAIDANDDIWVIDPIQSQLQRLDPNSSELCSYEVPNGGASLYVISHDNKLWLADYVNQRILSFNPVTNIWRYWSLKSDASPNSLIVDDAGNIWWSDETTGKDDGRLGRLNPVTNIITDYSPPYSSAFFIPNMLTFQDGRLWYTDGDLFADFGWIDPSSYIGSTNPPQSPNSTLGSEECFSPVSSQSLSVSKTTGIVNWTTTVLKEELHQSWAVYLLSTGASGWGIAVNGCNAWIVDQGLQRLVKLTFYYGGSCSAYLPMIVKP